MASLLIKSLILFLALASGSSAQYRAKWYRFDYEWSELAEGWLKYHVVPATWNRARMRCHAEGAILASPLTNELKAAIVSFAQKQRVPNPQQGHTIFTGVHSIFSQGDYSSIEGVPLLRLAIDWEAGEPDNYENSERCLAMMIGYNGTMADTRCERVLPYVCYKPDDELVTTECGTTDREYVLERRTGSCYKFHNIGLPWSEAYMTCVAEGGYLAIINDDREAELVEMILHRHSKKNIFADSHNSVFVGVHDYYGTTYNTIHGDILRPNNHNWAGGQPFNSTRMKYEEGQQYCGSVSKSAKLNSNNCKSVLAFLCEMNVFSLL